MNRKTADSLVIRKNILSRFGGFLLFIPFITSIRPLLKSHDTTELAVYFTGFVLTLALVIYSSYQPYIRVTNRNLYIYLLFRHKPEIHSLENIKSIGKKPAAILSLDIEGYGTIDLKLNRKNINKLTEIMEKEGIPYLQ